MLFSRSKFRLAGHALIVADYTSIGLSKSSVQVISAAKKFSDNCQNASQQAATVPGVTQVIVIGNNDKPFLADSLAVSISAIAKDLNATHIMGSTSSVSKETLPRIGALMNIQPISDIVEVIGDSTFKRPMYAGNVIATVESSDPVKILTVRPTAFSGDYVPADHPVKIFNHVGVKAGGTTIQFVSEQVKQNDKPELATANIVVAGGRALKSKENFDSVLGPLADKLKAGLGASRAAVDAGYAPNELQVGQTGKVVAPDLYIAVGISGAIQHLAGMKDSRTIVAINKDADAPIFQIADYGLVGDLFTIVPELTNKL